MTDDMKFWLPPMLSMLGALIVVVFTAWMNSRWVVTEIKLSRAEAKKELAEFETRLIKELGEIKSRIKALEERAGVIYHP